MIPLLASAATNPQVQNIGKKVLIGVGVAAAIGATIYFVNKAAKEQAKNQASNAYGDTSAKGLASQYAIEMRTALYAGWWGMTEDEKALYAIALNINKSKTAFASVQAAYKSLYDEDLIIKIAAKLNPQELDKFKQFLMGNAVKIS